MQKIRQKGNLELLNMKWNWSNLKNVNKWTNLHHAHLKIRKKISIWFFFSLGGGKVMIISISEVSSSSSRGRRGPPAGHQLPASSSYGRWESPLSSVIQGTNSLPPPYKPRSCNKMHRHAMKHSSFVKFLEVCSVHSHLYIIGRLCVFETKKWPRSLVPPP